MINELDNTLISKRIIDELKNEELRIIKTLGEK